ncbi:MAG: hypothetical protein AAFR81_07380 [Chloroflexota bacterium]
MSDENKTLGIALTDSIASEHLQELGVDIADVAVDSLVQNEVITEIPIVGTVYKAGKSLLAIRDALLLKKVLIYLREHQNIPMADRTNFLSGFSSESDKVRFGETVLMLLDSMSHFEKVHILGRFSRALFLDLISKSEFEQLADATQRVFVNDIGQLVHIASGKPHSENLATERLANVGLLSNYIDGLVFGKHRAKTEINALGRLFVTHGLTNW